MIKRNILFTVLCALAVVSAAGAEEDFTTGTPWIFSNLDGVLKDDMIFREQDDYFAAVNHDAIVQGVIPEGYSATGTIDDVVQHSSEELLALFTDDAPDSFPDAQSARNYFALLTDWDARNAAGVQPLADMLKPIEAIDSIEALNAYFLDTPVEDLAFKVFGVMPDVDLMNPDIYIMMPYVGGLLMGDSAEYQTLTEFGKIRQEARRELFKKIYVKLGHSAEEALDVFQRCLDFESALAPAVYSMADEQAPDYIQKIMNYYSAEEFAALQGNLPIIAFTEHVFGITDIPNYLVFNPQAIAKLNELYTAENLENIKAYGTVHAALNSADLLDRECYDWTVETRNTIIGASGSRPYEIVAAENVDYQLPWTVSRMYVEKYITEADKAAVAELIQEVVEGYKVLLSGADFISADTRAIAVNKLDKMTCHVLYPDEWDSYMYNGLTIGTTAEGWDLFRADAAVTRRDIQDMAKKYAAPVDHSRWSDALTPDTVNCFYNPSDNSINILAGFCRGGIYNSEMTREQVMGTLGVVIGHEISHAFDPTGSQFDEKGAYSDWWTEADHTAFNEKVAKIAAFYDEKVHPWEGQSLNGEILVGEVTADMGGVAVMLHAAHEIENFDYDAFFRAYANLWSGKQTVKSAYSQLKDSHPLDYLRVNVPLQQFDEFLRTYDVQPGDGMWLDTADRIRVW